MAGHDLFDCFVAPLARAAIEHFVTGSVAAMVYGEPRLTLDIDIVIHLDGAKVDALCAAFPLERYYCPPPEVIRVEIARESRGHFNLIHHETGLKAACYPLGHDELHIWALAHCLTVELDGERTMQVAPAEYVLVRKLEYYRAGGSEKHLRDIDAMLRISGGTIDLALVRAQAEPLGLTASLDDVLKRRADSTPSRR
ncbi:MAG: hypothetical protein HY903_08615 [Deltaproteobacteria bacterium]|nr:hypothetical protein [Deltaproteobacteria bacterium]